MKSFHGVIISGSAAFLLLRKYLVSDTTRQGLGKTKQNKA